MVIASRPYPLLSDELADRLGRLVAACARVGRELPAVAQTEDFGALAERLARLEEMARRPRLTVALLGPSQVGKTTTAVRLLGLRAGDIVGLAGALLEVPLRLFAQAGAGWLLRFLSVEEFQARRQALARELGLGAEDDPAALLAALAAWERFGTVAPGTAEGDSSAQAFTRARLARLLRSYQHFGAEYVRTPPQVRPATRSSWQEMMLQTGPDGASPTALLGEVEIAVASDHLPAQLELLDVPAADAAAFASEWLGENLPVHAALSFVPATALLAAQGVAHAARGELARARAALAERLLLVVTRIDQPDLSRPEVEETFLDMAVRLAREMEIPSDNIYFVSNDPHRDSPDLPADDPAAGSAAGLREALHEALRTGGLKRLRAWLGQLPGRLQETLQATAAAEEGALRQDLAARLRATRDGMRLQGGAFEPALLWQVQLQQLARDLTGERSLFEAPAKALAESLRQRFAAVCPPGLPLGDGERLRDVHRRVVLFLSAQATAQLREGVIPVVFGAVAERLRAIEQEVGAFPFAGHPGLAGAWSARQQADADAAWLEPVVRSLAAPLFAPTGPVGLSAADYRAVMAAKFLLVAQQAGGQVAERALRHLAEMGGELARIIDAFGRVDPADEVHVNDLLAALT
jgi:hypothetical protein